MLVDNPLYSQSPFFGSSSSSSATYSDYPTELSDIFDTELFNSTFPFASSSSRGSSPQSLLTPPQEPLQTFPEVHDSIGNSSTIASNAFFSLFDDELKSMDALPSLPTSSSDYMGMNTDHNAYGSIGIGGGVGCYSDGYELGGMGSMELNSMRLIDDPMQTHGIDPQLVDTPSAVSDRGDDEDSEDKDDSPILPPSSSIPSIPSSLPAVATSTSEKTKEKDSEKPTIIIAPVKAGGHGKARKGTVQSGGVVKKTPATSAAFHREKENSMASSSTSLTKKAKAALAASTSSASNSFLTNPSSLFLTGSANSSKADSEAGDAEDEDDLPQDWRPSPEVFAKMTSKEKRQLRNKISARNFRVRRKEYISTLEGDIAERDRMLDHFRSQLGSRESENLALRQEIAALKKALLDGRSYDNVSVNLPPPAPLPQISAAEALAVSAAASGSSDSSYPASAPLLTANTQKDLPSSPRMGNNRFWGGLGTAMGGGYTPVHTTLVPDIASVLRKGSAASATASGVLQENMNPALNVLGAGSANTHLGLGTAGVGKSGLTGFDSFADSNPFTLKSMDAYRMHLWGKMATQYHTNNNQSNSGYSQNNHHHNSPSNLVPGLRPIYFKAGNPSSSLSALLSGKHTTPSSYVPGNGTSAYPSPPSSPSLGTKGASQREREREQQQAMMAAMASQTLVRKLGSAFWDAFTGGSSSPLHGSASASSSKQSVVSPFAFQGSWDADKVRKVLEGKAVLRVVDVEHLQPSSTSSSLVVHHETTKHHQLMNEKHQEKEKDCVRPCPLQDILEESMRSLTIGKKA